ncbi:MAG: hypothetical protein ACJ76D_04490 [Solirubrobacterales bacterium]
MSRDLLGTLKRMRLEDAAMPAEPDSSRRSALFRSTSDISEPVALIDLHRFFKSLLIKDLGSPRQMKVLVKPDHPRLSRCDEVIDHPLEAVAHQVFGGYRVKFFELLGIHEMPLGGPVEMLKRAANRTSPHKLRAFQALKAADVIADVP